MTSSFKHREFDYILFKLVILVYKAPNGLSPQYLAADCQFSTISGRRRLRSSNVATREVRRIPTSLGDRSITVTGPSVCRNNLSLHLRDSEHKLNYSRGVPPVNEHAPVLPRTAAP